jgi:hypothetical protein
MGGVCVHVFVFVCVCWGYIHRWAFWGSSDFMCLLWLFSTLSSEVVSLTWTQNSLTWLVYLGSSPPGFPVSIVQAVRLYVRHHVHPELRQMLAIWTAVFMLASIYCSIFSRPKHILTCFTLTYLVYAHAHTCMYATVNVWQSNYNLPKLVLSFHHGPVLRGGGLAIRIWSSVADTLLTKPPC